MRARRSLLVARRSLRYRRHLMSVGTEPDRSDAGDAGAAAYPLRSHRGGRPRRDVLVSYRANPADPLAAPVLLVEREGERVVAAELPPARAGHRSRQLVCLPARSGPLSVRYDPATPGPPLADVRVHELGTIVFSLVLAFRWVARQVRDPRQLPRRAVKGARYLRSGGVGAVRTQLLRGETRALRLEARARARSLGPGGATPMAPASRPEMLAERKRVLAAELGQELEEFLAGDDRLVLPRAGEPAVSIVLVLYNRAELTLACLRSIVEHAGDDVEVVVVDNASQDRTAELLDRVDGGVVVRNTDNVGFLRAVNQAVGHARGAALLLLNNDASMRAGSLAAARRVLDDDPRVGVVGGPLVLADGWLQEAGSVVYADGSCEGYGRDCDPADPEMQFRRDVDFVSGAFLLTPRSLWDQLGGFDDALAPAYYEDVDYCVRVWQAGFRVVYEPGAVVDHYEYGSAADPEWARERMRTNREIFVARHGDWLAAQPRRLDPPHLVRTRDRRPRVLVIDDRVPLPHLGSGGPRMAAFVRALEQLDYAVTFYSKLPTEATWPEVREVLSPGVEVVGFDDLAGLEDLIEARPGAFQAIVVSRHHNAERIAPMLERQRAAVGDAVIVYDAEALATNRAVARRAALGLPLDADEAERLIAEEAAQADFADRVVAVSEREAHEFRRHTAASVLVLGHGVDPCPGGTPFDRRRGLLFVGTLTEEQNPNVDALLWFLDEVFPRTVELLSGAGVADPALTVVGRATVLTLRSRRVQGVRFAGTVGDLTPVYDSARVFIAPTRFAAGIPLKVVDAAAAGVPSVTTELLADQLGWKHEHEVMAGRLDPAHFAEQCARLYLEADLWHAVREGALARVAEEHSLDALRRRAGALVAPVSRDTADIVEGLPR